jgi:hypothetical protein
MKLLLFLIASSCSWLCLSQTKDTVFIIRYHQNKKIATKQVKLSNEQNWGYAKAFDQQGKEIYFMHTRSVAGHATVEFIYYPSGAVKQAHFTSHPDGGIQWSDIMHRFDETGKITEVIDTSSDDYGHHRLTINPKILYDTLNTLRSPTVVLPPKKQEVMACAEIYTTTIYLINVTGKSRNFKALQLKSSFDELQQKGEIAKNDTVKIGSYHEPQIFTHPKECLKLEFLGKKKDVFQFFWEEPKQDGISNRKYYLIALKR